MARATAFLEHERREPGYRPVGQRIQDFRAVELSLSEQQLMEQASRCMDCGTPFCHGYGCPVGNVVPEFNEHIYHGRWHEALDVLLERNNFPEFTGRVCPALCEGSCVLGINDEPVTIRQIELKIIEKGYELGYMKPVPPAVRKKGRVAVVGSGPAGLTVADVLNRLGYNVVVYDEGLKPGGILRYGIPDFKLEKWVIDRRIELMEAQGVLFENSVRVGHDISHHYLRSRFDAICLAGGAREARDLLLPGRELTGVHLAMDFLVQQNRRIAGETVEPGTGITAEGKDVLVIGGGDTGADCAGTAIRQGARTVTQFEIMPEPPPARSPATPWPMWPLKLRTSSSHGEGCIRRWGVATERFLGTGGAVTAVEAVEVDLVKTEGKPDSFVPRPGSGFVIEAGLVLIAMGFSGPGQRGLVEDLGMETTSGGMIVRGGDTMTSVPGIFVTGDMAQGASLVVRAMRDGRETAGRIAAYLGSKE